MNQNPIFDAGSFIKDPGLASYVRVFSANAIVAEQAISRFAARADAAQAAELAKRQDADVSGITPRALAWEAHVAEISGNDTRRRDSLIRSLRPAIVPARQDSGAAFLPTQGKVEIGAPIVARIQDRDDLLVGIPTRPVDGNASGYTRNFIKPGGTATLINGEQTQINRVNYTVGQDLRPLHWCGVALSTGWLEARRTAQAGVDDARWKMEGINRAIRDFWWGAILDGRTVPGLDFYSLATIPGVLKVYSTQTIGTAAIADVLPVLVTALTNAAERSPADLKPDVAIITDRLRNRLMRTTAAPYSPLNAWSFFESVADGLGMKVITGKSLRDFPASGYDSLLTARTDANEGLRRVTGLDVTPVHTYVDAAGQTTIYASSGGGLELPYAEGCEMTSFPWSA